MIYNKFLAFKLPDAAQPGGSAAGPHLLCARISFSNTTKQRNNKTTTDKKSNTPMGFFRAAGLACKAAVFTAKVGINATGRTVKGVKNTVNTVTTVAKDIRKGDYDQALEHAGEHLERSLYGIGSSIENSVRLLDAAAKAKSADEFFSSSHNVKLASSAAMLAVGSAIAVNALSDDDDAAAVDGPIPGMDENGMFTGDEDDLQELIAAGEVPDSEHVDNVERDLSARGKFLAAHGWDSVPEGYEVHHIQPLSEGGSDTPDNMILVSKEDHDIITAAHRRYYHWS